MSQKNKNQQKEDPSKKMDIENAISENSQYKDKNPLISTSNAINQVCMKDQTYSENVLQELQHQILKEKPKLKQTQFSAQNDISSERKLLNITNSDPRCIQGYIQNVKQATKEDFPNCGIRKNIIFYQFTLTSSNAQKYLILVHNQFWPNFDNNYSGRIMARLYLPQSQLKAYQESSETKKFLIFKPKPKPQPKPKPKKQEQTPQPNLQHQIQQKFEETDKSKQKTNHERGNYNRDDQNFDDQQKKPQKKPKIKKKQKGKNKTTIKNKQQQIKETKEQNQQSQNSKNQQIFIVLSEPHLMLQPWINVDVRTLYQWSDCQRYRVLSQYVLSQYEQRENILFRKVCFKYMKYMLDHKQTFRTMLFKDAHSIVHDIYQQHVFQMYLLTRNNGIHADFLYFYTQCEQMLSQIHFFIRDHVIQTIPFQGKNRSFKILDILSSQTLHSTQFFGLRGKIDAFFEAQMKLDKYDKESPWVAVYIAFSLKSGFHKKKHNDQSDVLNMLIQQKLLNQSKNIKIVGLTMYVGKNGTKIEKQLKRQNDYQMYISERNKFVFQQAKLFSSDLISLPPLYKKKEIKDNKINCNGCYAVGKCEIFHIIESIDSPNPNFYQIKYGLIRTNRIKQNQQKTQQLSQIPDIQEVIPSEANDDDKLKEKINNISLQELNYAKKWFRWLHIEQRESLAEKQEQRSNLYHIKPNDFIITKAELQKIQTGYLKQKANHQKFSYNKFQDQDAKKIRFVIEKQVLDQSHLDELEKLFIDQKKLSITILSIGIDKKTSKVFSVTKIIPHLFLVEIQIYTKLHLSENNLRKAIQNGTPIRVEILNFSMQGQNNQRLNIINLILTEENQQLKKLIIAGQQPKKQTNCLKNNKKSNRNKVLKMENEENPQMLQENDCLINQINSQKFSKPMNEQQQKALQRIIGDSFCTLVKGMPGTGKTDLIVRVLDKYKRMQNKTVLIASFTNRALDNILQRAYKFQVISKQETMREGNQQNIDDDFLQINSKNLNFKEVAEYQRYFQAKRFWFTTLSSVSTNQLLPKKFDLVILDQASQCLESLCIGALIRGQKIVMIGDYKQLSPLVRAKIPFLEGMGTSLFQRLCLDQPSALVQLTKQYRMNNKILNFCNQLVYDKKLETGLEKVKTWKIQLNQKQWEKKCLNHQLKMILDPNNEVLMVNHQNISNQRQNNQQKQELSHIMEVQIACVLLFKFIQLGIDPQEITIICLYNKTVEIIKRLIKKIHSNIRNQSNPNLPKLSTSQVLTIDKSQGMDKQVVIFVAEMKFSFRNTLIQDQRRVNVALTRAKKKMIILGSLVSLSEVKVFKREFFKLLKSAQQLRIKESFFKMIMSEFSARLNKIQKQMTSQSQCD